MRSAAQESRIGQSGLRRVLWTVALLLAAIALLHARPARAETVTLEQYRERLAAALAKLERTPTSNTDLTQIAAELASITAVQLPSGETLALPTPLLHGAEHNLEAARLRLGAAEAQIRLSAGDDLAARSALLAAILARPAFRNSESLWDRFLRWLDAWWQRLFARRTESPFDSPAAGDALDAVGWLITGVGGVLIVALLAWWLRGFIAGFVGDAELRRRRAAGEETPLTAEEARRQAAEQARAGSFREAVRSLYLSALLSLEERAVVVQDRTLTNRELLARSPALGDHLAPVVQTFDEVWYGVREPDAEVFEAYRREVAALEATPARTDEVQP